MARYVGDLTDPKNSEERKRAAMIVEKVAIAVRNREVKRLDINWDRNVIPDTLGIQSKLGLSAWTVGMEVTRRGRHEKRLGGD